MLLTFRDLFFLIYNSQDGNYEDALAKFTTALQNQGFKPYLAYNIALCYYKLKDYGPSLKFCGNAEQTPRWTTEPTQWFSADIIEKGIRDHPELSIGMQTEGIEVRSVGNTLTLHETSLTEAFNLKAAIEFQLKNRKYWIDGRGFCIKTGIFSWSSSWGSYRHATKGRIRTRRSHSPQSGPSKFRAKSNRGLWKTAVFAATKPVSSGNVCQLVAPLLPARMLRSSGWYSGWKRPSYLQVPYSGKQQFFNWKKPRFQWALLQYLYDFLDGIITQQTSPSEAYQKFDELASRHTEQLRKLAKQVQEHRNRGDIEVVKKAIIEYEDCLERCLYASLFHTIPQKSVLDTSQFWWPKQKSTGTWRTTPR